MKKIFLIFAAGAGRRLARLFCGMMGKGGHERRLC
jgi:hypothetical protein